MSNTRMHLVAWVGVVAAAVAVTIGAALWLRSTPPPSAATPNSSGQATAGKGTRPGSEPAPPPLPWPNTEGVTPDPFGTIEQVYAAVPSEYAHVLRSKSEPAVRDVLARSFAADWRIGACSPHLQPFLDYLLRTYRPQAKKDESRAAFDRDVAAGAAVGVLIQAWLLEPCQDPRVLRETIGAITRIGEDRLSTNRAMALTLFMVLEWRGMPGLSEPTLRQTIDKLRSNATIKFTAERSFTMSLEEAKQRRQPPP